MLTMIPILNNSKEMLMTTVILEERNLPLFSLSVLLAIFLKYSLKYKNFIYFSVILDINYC